jgi:hypothetical protein
MSKVGLERFREDNRKLEEIKLQERKNLLEDMITDEKEEGAASLLSYVKEGVLGCAKYKEGEHDWALYAVTLMPSLFKFEYYDRFAELKYAIWKDVVEAWLTTPTPEEERLFLQALLGKPHEQPRADQPEGRKICEKLKSIMRDAINAHTHYGNIDRLVRALTAGAVEGNLLIDSRNYDFVNLISMAIAKHSSHYQNRVAALFLELFGMSTTPSEVTDIALYKALEQNKELIAQEIAKSQKS